MFPVVLEIGPITIYSYGLMLAVAFLVCGHLYAKELARRGMDPELAGSVVMWAVLGGVAGARLYYLAENWDEVRGRLLASMFSGSGLVAYGGFAGGVLACWIVLRAKRVRVLRAFDASAPFLALGYAIGRIGCLLAGDGDYGPPSDLPWAIAFPHGVVPALEPRHPTPAYETLMMLGAFALLFRLRTRPWPDGRLFALYLVLQGIERFVAEWWRINPHVWLGLSRAQLIAAATAAAGAVWLAALGRAGAARSEPLAKSG